jgi:hypothetical protein
MRKLSAEIEANKKHAREMWDVDSSVALEALEALTKKFNLSIGSGHLLFLNSSWYVTHSGLLSIASRRHCRGIQVRPEAAFCNPGASMWAFRATVYKSPRCKGFVGFGDANPSNVSPVVNGAEMRIAETRAVNRALRKAYGIGICSVEEIGAVPERAERNAEPRKLPPQPANGNDNGGPRVRDRLCQLIRQHSLDPELVKSYATDFCGTKMLKEATRAQVENFVAHLADWAEKDRNALLCQLNSYIARKDKEGAA